MKSIFRSRASRLRQKVSGKTLENKKLSEKETITNGGDSKHVLHHKENCAPLNEKVDKSYRNCKQPSHCDSIFPSEYPANISYYVPSTDLGISVDSAADTYNLQLKNSNNNNNKGNDTENSDHQLLLNCADYRSDKVICGKKTNIDNNYNYSCQFSTWFRPTLGYVFEAEKHDRNEITVLSLGIRQYLDDIYDALDFNKAGYVHCKDLEVLCKLLGKTYQSDVTEQSCTNLRKECTDINCPVHLHYTEYTRILLNLFGADDQMNILESRNNGKLVDAVVNITRRHKSLSYVSKLLDEIEAKLQFSKTFESSWRTDEYYANFESYKCDTCSPSAGLDKNRNIYTEGYKTGLEEKLELQRTVVLQIQELQCLREIIEDLRIALQRSDAENIGLRVKEEREKLRSHNEVFNHDDEMLKQSSFPDEEDSIDRLIINFPSDEALHKSDNSKEVITLPEGAEDAMDHENHPIKENFEHKLKDLWDKSYDDLRLQEELQNAYQEIFDIKTQLDNLKSELESSMTEIRDKEQEISRVQTKLYDATKTLENTLRNNLNLGEELKKCHEKLEEKASQVKNCETEIEVIKAECREKQEGNERLQRDLERIKDIRRHELNQFRRTRKLVAKSLVETRRVENRLQSLMSSRSWLPEGHTDNVTNDGNYHGFRDGEDGDEVYDSIDSRYIEESGFFDLHDGDDFGEGDICDTHDENSKQKSCRSNTLYRQDATETDFLEHSDTRESHEEKEPNKNIHTGPHERDSKESDMFAHDENMTINCTNGALRDCCTRNDCQGNYQPGRLPNYQELVLGHGRRHENILDRNTISHQEEKRNAAQCMMDIEKTKKSESGAFIISEEERTHSPGIHGSLKTEILSGDPLKPRKNNITLRRQEISRNVYEHTDRRPVVEVKPSIVREPKSAKKERIVKSSAMIRNREKLTWPPSVTESSSCWPEPTNRYFCDVSEQPRNSGQYIVNKWNLIEKLYNTADKFPESEAEESYDNFYNCAIKTMDKIDMSEDNLFHSPRFDNSTTVSATSTQVLENLEAEVERLRKTLEEDLILG